MRNFFELLVENMTFPVWIKNLDFKFIFVNKRYAEINNKKIEDFIGLRNEDIFEATTCEKFNKHCEKAIESKYIVTEQIYQGERFVECTVIPLKDEKGNIIALAGIVGLLTEVGVIKEKEYELEMQKILTKQIIDVLPGFVFYKDINSKYVFANKNCTNFYKERGVTNIIGKTDAEINSDKEQVEKFLKDDITVATTKKPIYNEVEFINPDGSKMYTEVIKMPLLDSYGNVKGIVGRSLDITEKKIAQERLEYLSYVDILTEAKNRRCFEVTEKKLSKEQYMPIGVIMGDSNGLKLVNDTFGHNHGDKLLKEVTKVLKDCCEGIGEVFRTGGDEFAILIPNATMDFCEEIIKKIHNSCKEYKNKLFNISISLGAALKEKVDEDIYKVLKEAEDKVYRQKLLQNSSIKRSILNSLKIGLSVRSGETEEHNKRVSEIAIKIGEKLNLPMSVLDELKIAAELHDIGKIGISEEILLKKDKLTEEEFNIIKTHSEKGYRIIKASSELKRVAQGVLYHHERWDGKGYPMGLKNKEIPLIS